MLALKLIKMNDTDYTRGSDLYSAQAYISGPDVTELKNVINK